MTGNRQFDVWLGTLVDDKDRVGVFSYIVIAPPPEGELAGEIAELVPRTPFQLRPEIRTEPRPHVIYTTTRLNNLRLEKLGGSIVQVLVQGGENGVGFLPVVHRVTSGSDLITR